MSDQPTNTDPMAQPQQDIPAPQGQPDPMGMPQPGAPVQGPTEPAGEPAGEPVPAEPVMPGMDQPQQPEAPTA